MRARLSVKLWCSADRAWQRLQTSASLAEVNWPLVTVRPESGKFPERWREGDAYSCDCRILGAIPIRRHQLHFERIDASRRSIQTREKDPLVKVWDHLARIEPIDERRCRLTDEIEIQAGLFTPLVVLFAIALYHYRHHRWQFAAWRLGRA